MKKSMFLHLGLVLATLAGAVACGGGKEKVPTTYKDVSLTVNWATNPAKTTWTAGETIRLYSQTESGAGSPSLLTYDGSQFKASSVSSASSYRLVYPSSASIGSFDAGMFASVPTTQKLAAGGIGAESFLAAGFASDLKSAVTLMPMVAIVKFSVSGKALEEGIRTTTIESSDHYIAGDVFISGTANSPAVESNGTRGVVAPTKAVNLTGALEAGKTYYAGIIGAGEDNLALSFTSPSGKMTRKEMGKVNLSRGQVTDLGNIDLGDSLDGDADFLTYCTATADVPHPIVLTFMSSGFVESEREDFIAAARSAADLIFEVEPFKHFKSYFSVYIGWKAAPNGLTTEPWNVPTYTDANRNKSFNSLAQADRNKVHNWIAERAPELVSGKANLDDSGVFMIIKSDSYIGAVCDWDGAHLGRFIALVDYTSSSFTGTTNQTYGATSSGNVEGAEDGSTYTLSVSELEGLGYKTATSSGGRVYQSTYRGTILHEGMGHGFTRLMDEYWIYTTNTFPGSGSWYTDLDTKYHTLALPTGMNISTSKTETPWDNLLAMRDELIAKDQRYERIGVFQGGLVSSMWGVWRPERVSVMMDCRPYFSTFQRALAWQRIMRASGENPTCDVVNSAEDLRTYMALDVEIGGIFDPARDE